MGPTGRVLIVEDEAEEARFLLDAFERGPGDTEVEATPSTDRALELLDDRSFDCVIQAFDLPECHGVDLVRRLRGSGHDLPVVIRTDRDAEALKENAMVAGADAVVPKTRDEAQIRRTVETLIGPQAPSPSS